MPRDPRDLLPLKPVVFQILLILAEEDRHGWSLIRELDGRGGRRLLPGNFYRVLQSMLAEDLIDEVDPSKAARERAAIDTGANAQRRQYLRLTAFGRDVARAEARRLARLVDESRAKKLLSLKERQ